MPIHRGNEKKTVRIKTKTERDVNGDKNKITTRPKRVERGGGNRICRIHIYIYIG